MSKKIAQIVESKRAERQNNLKQKKKNFDITKDQNKVVISKIK